MSSWFFVKDGERQGPVTRAELDAHIAEGAVNGDTLVWRVGLGAWQPAGRLPELGLPPPLSRPPAPPPQEDEVDADEVDVPEQPALARPSFSVVRAPGITYAGFGLRLAAKLIDLCFLLVVGQLVQQVVAHAAFDGVIPNMMEDWAGWLRFGLVVAPINITFAIAYSVFFILREEATPGKRLLGLRVVRANGDRLGAGRVIGRYFAEQVSGIVFLAGYVMAAFDEEKRTLHDMMCDTRVVKGPRE